VLVNKSDSTIGGVSGTHPSPYFKSDNIIFSNRNNHDCLIERISSSSFFNN